MKVTEKVAQARDILRSTTHGTGPLPTFLTTDAAGRIMEPRDGLLHPTSSWINITPQTVTEGEHAQRERGLLQEALTNNPQWLIGRHAHKFFPEWNGICRAIVNSYNANKKLWTVTYEANNEIEEFERLRRHDEVRCRPRLRHRRGRWRGSTQAQCRNNNEW
eukprot:COSAG01_NODE_1435_length_10315_cov_5.427075_7_plen_162_part_00